MSTTKVVTFTESCFVDGELCERDETKELPEKEADQLIAMGRAKLVDDAEVESAVDAEAELTDDVEAELVNDAEAELAVDAEFELTNNTDAELVDVKAGKKGK